MTACPDCGAALDREEVDIGVGTLAGPWSCPECGWREPVDPMLTELDLADDTGAPW